MKTISSEFLQILKERKLLVAIIAIIIVPILYAGMFLYAFWDPYDHLADLPIAVVNEDVGAYQDGEFVDIGSELIENLQDEEAFDLHFVDKATGESGLEAEDYYILIKVPENFSENALSVMDEHPKKAELIYVPNESYNFLASQIGETAMLQIEVALQEKITETYMETIFEMVTEFADGLQDASEATIELEDGASELQDGAIKISDNLHILAGKFLEFSDGMHSAKDGTEALVIGAEQLNDGLDELNDASNRLLGASLDIETGTKDLQTGIHAIDDGTRTIHENIPALMDGTEQVIDGLTAFQNQLPTELTAEMKQEMTDQIDELIDNLTIISEDFTSDFNADLLTELVDKINAKQAEQAALLIDLLKENGVDDTVIDSINDRLNQGQMTTKQLAKELEAMLNESFSKIEKQLAMIKLHIDEKITATTNEIEQSISLAVDPVFNQLVAGLNTIKGGQTSLYTGVSQLVDGSNALNIGAEKLTAGQSEYVANMKEFSGKMADASAGTSTLQAGTTDLLTGMNELTDATLQLEDGTIQLADGADELSDGMDELVAGTEEFTVEMQDAATEANDIETDEATYNMLATPVETKNDKINEVPNYGTGFAPYFLSLGLFVGALLMSIVFPLREPASRPKNAFEWFYSKFAVIFVIGVLQALLASGFLLIVLGLEVQNIPLFLVYAVITSLVFVTLIQFLVTCLEDPGRFIAILILIIQLTTSAGTFPLELIPKILQPLSALLPMTYSVAGFKAVISSGEYGVMWQNAGILLGFTVVFILLTYSYFAVMFKRKFGKHSEEKSIA